MTVPDRRSNHVLRALIDDMLDRVRKLSRDSSLLSDDARRAAEDELEELMVRVRRLASQGEREYTGPHL